MKSTKHKKTKEKVKNEKKYSAIDKLMCFIDVQTVSDI